MVRSLVIAPVPLTIAAAAMIAYLALAIAGVSVPRLEMYAPVVWRGPRKTAAIALTFNVGPQPIHTSRILDILDEHGVKGTFFVMGRQAEQHPDCVAEIARRGHELGTQGYEQDRFLSLRMPGRIIDDTARGLNVVERITGLRPTMFRPSDGRVSPRTDTAATTLELDLVTWSVEAAAGAKPADVAAQVNRGLRPGAIVLLHEAASSEALPAILREASAKGLTCAMVSEFVRLKFES